MVERLGLDAQYKFLKSADNIKDFENRSEKIWDEFFFLIFCSS